MRTGIVSNFCAGIAIVSILFLPVVGCADQNMSGLQLLNESQVDMDMKYFLIGSLICAGMIFLFRLKGARIIAAILGFIFLISAYLIAHSKNELIELRFGSVIAFLSFGYVVISNALFESETQPDQSVIPPG